MNPIVVLILIFSLAFAVYWFVIKEDSETTPLGITNYEDYISKLTFDWSTERTIGIINNNSYAPNPTELYEKEVSEETRILLGRTVEEFNNMMTDDTESKYGNYCKLKAGMLYTHGISSGSVFDEVSRTCRNEMSTLLFTH